MPRAIPVIPAQKILQLEPRDVSLSWATSIPSTGLKECEVRLAKEAAAAAGFDLVTITGNIHPTTTHGTRRDKPHMTVKFRSTRYNSQTEQTVHINVHVWNPRLQQWTRYPSSGRPADYPYHNVYQDGNIRFYRPLPRSLAQDEIHTQERRR
ncbi:hypothetical protein DL767_000944 [Monosporascus sp. MG133]|nr:hypothetical protein DL767_000944 [Monosporascus sp. MG133]